MMKRVALTTLTALIIVCLVPVHASAQAVCGSGFTFLPPDGRIFTYTSVSGISYSFIAGTNLTSGGVPRSYSVEVIALNSGFNAPDLFVRNDSLCPLAHLGPAIRDTRLIEPRVGCDACSNANRRFSFTTTDRFTNFVVHQASGVSEPYTISVAETTMFGTAWSTNGAFDTFYSFYNTTSQTITANLTLTTVAGAGAGTTVLVIPPFLTASTNTVALGTPNDQAGTARLTHDGPPGAILVEADIANFSTSPAYIQPVRFAPIREVR